MDNTRLKTSGLPARSWSKKWLLAFMAATFLVSAIFSIERAHCSEPLIAKPENLHETFLMATGSNGMEPLAAMKASDGGFFLAGGGGTAWAAKVDAQGASLWNYFTPFERWSKGTVFYPEFRGVAAMSDGSAYFCGFMTNPPGQYQPGLLTHLDANGQVLSERLVLPSKRASSGIARFDDCIQWAGGVVVLGHIVDVLPSPSVPAVSGIVPIQNSYWIILFNGANEIVWETKISSSIEASEFGPILSLANNNLTFSATDNVNTNIVLIDRTGMVLAQKTVPGRYKMVKNIGKIQNIELFGDRNPPDYTSVSSIDFDDNLEETRRIDEVGNLSVIPYIVYKLPDSSFVTFGATMHDFGPRYSSSAVHFDPTLKSEQGYEFPYIEASHDLGFVKAAVAVSSESFLAARTFRVIEENAEVSDGLPPGFKRGAVLNFLSVKQ